MKYKSLLLASAVTFIVAFPISVNAEVYKKDALITLDKPKAGGGEGTLYGKFSFTRDKATKDQAIKEIGWMTLQPGDSVGYHQHTSNEDSYIIISGKGTFVDSDGKEYPVEAGDITIARKGDSHALINSGDEPLIFLDVIAEQ